MGLFKKKKPTILREFECPVAGCPFTCTDPITLKKHTDWKHPELAEMADKK